MEQNTSNQKPYTLEPNIEAALAYLIAPVTGIVVYIFEKENKFVRFHAMQSILFGVAALVAQAIAGALVAVLIGILLVPLVSLTTFILWLILMWKAFNNQEWELPVLGKIAREQINKTS